jgi:peptidoglycan/xylan/chitin deacetylase (PgdA/CDA1 family)
MSNRWPDGARLAVSIVVNVEWWSTEMPSPFFFPFPPDAKTDRDSLTVTDREYGYRVGLGRFLDLFDRYGIKSTMVVSGLAAEVRPQAILEIHHRGHEIAGHGYDQKDYLVSMTPEEERETVHKTLEAIERVIGNRPIGWMSPAARSTPATSRILLEHGFLNHDHRLFNYGNPPMLPSHMVEWLRYEFDALYEEGANVPKMMSIGLHPYVTGRPARSRALEEFIRYAKGLPGVWFPRRDEIASWWDEQGYS